MASTDDLDGDHVDGGLDATAIVHGSPPPQDPAVSSGQLRSWSDLPKELVELIAEKLHSHVDLRHFSFVCKRMHSVIVENLKRLPYHLPICHCLHEKLPLPVLMRCCNKEDMVMEFVCLPDEKVCGKLHLPELRNKVLVGSSKGWLVTVDIYDGKFYLTNPLTKNQMQLPPFSLSLMDSGVEETDYQNLHLFVNKVVLTSNPKLSSKDCLVVASLEGCKSLAFCQLGDSGWTGIKDSQRSIHDIIYYKENLFVVGDGGQIEVIVDVGPNAKAKMVVGVPYENGSISFPSRCYLVESSRGELLLVVRLVTDGGELDLEPYDYEGNGELDPEPYDYEGNGELDPKPYHYETTDFCVFRLDCADLYSQSTGLFDLQYPNDWCSAQRKISCNWSELESLGGDMLFVGKNCSMAISSSLHPEGKADCIYFTNDILYYNPKYGIADQGIYDMKSGHVLPYALPTELCLPPVWVTPNPW